MGIKLLFLLLLWSQGLEYLWMQELSVRTELLGYFSPGIIQDTLTDIFLNPASAANITKNRLYFNGYERSYHFHYDDYHIRGAVLTNFGFNVYIRTILPFSVKKLTDLPEKKIGIVYARKVGKQSLGIGYLYSYDYRNYYYGFPVDSEKIYSFSLGMILNELVDGVITFSKFWYEDYCHWAPKSQKISKSRVNAGIGIKGRINNYFSITYISLIDTSSHYNITVFDRVGAPIVNTQSTKIYTIGQLEYLYYYRPPHPQIEGMKTDTRIIFRLGIGVEQLLGNFSILGNFSQHIGHCINHIEHDRINTFTFFSDYPICLGLSMKATPLKLWVRMSPLISACAFWNIELLYILN